MSSMAKCATVVLACVSAAWAAEIETITVGNPGNADDTHGDGYGGVDYVYNIGKFEVTAGQYTEFLNAVAATDPYELYDTWMDGGYGCQITRHGTSGSYTYDCSGGTVETPGSMAVDWKNRPVNYVSWGDAARFANWLHNGQPIGAQDPATTEEGSYYLNGATTDEQLLAVVREPDATWVIPSEDEWYKAAYHKNDGVTGNYWDYPTGTDATPNNGDPEGDTGNSVNFGDGTVGIFDIFCILNGFGGDFSVCSFEDDDIDPCTPDGTIGIFGLFAVLNAFGGADPCCGGLP